MKDPFVALDSDFKDSIGRMGEDQIRSVIAKVSLNQVELLVAKDADLDLAQKKEAAKDAGAIYREGTRANKLRILFCHRALGDAGKDTGSFDADEVAEENQNGSEREQGL